MCVISFWRGMEEVLKGIKLSEIYWTKVSLHARACNACKSHRWVYTRVQYGGTEPLHVNALTAQNPEKYRVLCMQGLKCCKFKGICAREISGKAMFCTRAPKKRSKGRLALRMLAQHTQPGN